MLYILSVWDITIALISVDKEAGEQNDDQKSKKTSSKVNHKVQVQALVVADELELEAI